MNAEVDLVNLDPTLQLLAIGAALAALPIAWWAWSQRGQGPQGKLRALIAITLFLTFDLVLFGAFTRLTDSGLGCPDWPGCYGSASPIGAKAEIKAAEAAMPGGPVTLPKAWIEMIHRKAATGVGALITLIMVLGFAWRKKLVQAFAEQGRRFSPWWGVLAFVWVCAQGAFGALTVTLKLQPIIVTLHLMGGVGLLMVLTALLQYFKNNSDTSNEYQDRGAKLLKKAGSEAISVRPDVSRGLGKGLDTSARTVGSERPVLSRSGGISRVSLRTLWAILFAATWVQIALGGWVSTNYAVVACMEFPTCQGSLWPKMALAEGFALWRELGKTSDGGLLSMAALVGIHYVHRLAAYVLFALGIWAAWRAWQSGVAMGKTTAKWVAALMLWQLATGLGNVLLGWPLLAAVAHTGGGAALVIVLTRALAASRRSPQREVATRAETISP